LKASLRIIGVNMGDLSKHHATYEPRLRRRRSAEEAIDAAPYTILMNIMIEVFAALIMVIGLTYLIRFMIVYRDRFQAEYYKYVLVFIILFSIGWATHLIFNFISHIRRYRKAVAAKQARNRRLDMPVSSGPHSSL